MLNKKFLIWVAINSIRLIIIGVLVSQTTLFAQLPPGFEYNLFSDEIPGAVTVEFAENGNIYASDFQGKVWVFIDGELQTEPVIDISDEVAGYAELGCLSFALHPDFMLNGYVYLLYVADRHHLLHYGTENYDPNSNEYDAPTIGRLTRFQLQLNDYTTLIEDSRTVLFGENIGEGNVSLTVSHGTGDIVFGEDGSLLFSTGDGNTWASYYAGGDEDFPSFSFDEQALEDGILSLEEHVGSFRAQMLDSYSGKVLRIDPLTGEGLPSNPFYDETDPNGAQSKVWALGLRNPYRLSLRPNSGSQNPDDGNPGTLYISDVGFNEWEEINVSDGGGQNFGWPLYEGMGKQNGFYNKVRKNLYQPNPFQSEGCPDDFFTFQQLFQQENAQHNYFFPNPCNSEDNIANYADAFYHARPVIAYRNAAQVETPPLLPGFDGDGAAIGIEITSSEADVEQAELFNGIAAMTGDFYNGQNFPDEYQGILPVLDYQGWLKVFWFDDNHEITKMEHWLSGLQNVVDIKFNPQDECYYSVRTSPAEISRLCFVGNLSPVIQATATPQYGTSPLEVAFDASETYDPDGDPLTFQWDFGDGSDNNQPQINHSYVAPSSAPHSFNATLTVNDTSGNEVVKSFLISVNNTPPAVEITSFSDSTLYAMDTPTSFPLEAAVSDAEHDIGELSFEWNTYLHHNTHYHSLSSSNDISGTFVLYPVGCGPVDSYYFRVSLAVYDPEGLVGYDEVKLYPDCNNSLSISDSASSNGFLLFPNPATDYLSLRILNPESISGQYDIEIFDMLGRVVAEQQFIWDSAQSSFVINVEHLPAGQYFLRTKRNQVSYSNRFIVAKP